jgi:hypothetical protein
VLVGWQLKIHPLSVLEYHSHFVAIAPPEVWTSIVGSGPSVLQFDEARQFVFSVSFQIPFQKSENVVRIPKP